MTDEKTSSLESLSAVIGDLYSDFKREDRIGDPHHILYAGNPNAKIIVLQLHPDWAEVNAAKRNNIHNNFVCAGPGGNFFKDVAKRSGFDINDDFFYANILPYYPVAGSKYPDATIDKLIWSIDNILEIIQPKIIITLGYDCFTTLLRTADKKVDNKLSWEHLISKTHSFLKLDEYILVPLQDPYIVMSENFNKNKSFYTTLKVLYTSVRYLTKYLEGDENGRAK